MISACILQSLKQDGMYFRQLRIHQKTDINPIANKSMNLNAITENFDVSRPAISQHIKILTECGIISIEQIGRERYCKNEPATLREVAEWVEPYRQLWEQKLDSFENYLNKLQSKRTKNAKAKRRK